MRANTRGINVSGIGGYTWESQKKENVKRATCRLSAAKTESRVDTLPQNVEKDEKNMDTHVSEPH
jgi:hypothetical protein